MRDGKWVQYPVFAVCHRLGLSAGEAVCYILGYVCTDSPPEVLFGDEFKGLFASWVSCGRCIVVGLDDS